jgi:hypothetical protein
MAAHVRAPVLPVTPEKPAVAGGMEQHRPPTPPLIGSSRKLSKEELNLTREIAEDESRLTFLLEVKEPFQLEFKELMIEHARVMASMAEALAKYAENAGGDMHILVDRYEDAEKNITSTIQKIFEKAVNDGLSLPPVPSIKRKARKKKAKVAPPEPPAKVSVKTAVCYVAIYVKGVPETVPNDEIQTEFDTKALVGRFPSGYCKVLVPESELGRALSQKSVSGHKIHVKRWRVRDLDHHRNGRRHRLHDGRNWEVPTRTVETCMNSMGKTIGTRMKSIEMAMYDMKRVLKRIASTEKRA